MNRNNKSHASKRSATPESAYNNRSADIDPTGDWFNLGKPSRINRQPKRGWKRGARK